MAITRTPIIDDDGSGTSGTVIDNAWKQEFYNQIDAYLPVSALTAFVPTDVSGAGLAFTYKTGFYVKIGIVVVVLVQVIYPATANGANAVLGGLPFPVRAAPAGLVSGYGVHHLWYLATHGTTMAAINPANSAPRTNTELSGQNLVLSGVYLTD